MPLPVSVIPYDFTAFGGGVAGIAEPPRRMRRHALTACGPIVASRSSAAGTSEMSVDPSRLAKTTVSTSKAGSTVRPVPVSSARVTTDSPPTWANGRQARALMEKHQIDIVITDLVMPEEEGIETIIAIKKAHPTVKIVAMSGAFGCEMLAGAQLLGAQATLAKPLSVETVLACLGNLV